MAEQRGPAPEFTARIVSKRWLSGSTFELVVEKPAGFDFLPGQKVLCTVGELSREYTLACSPAEETLTLLIRQVQGAGLSSRMAGMDSGERVVLARASGFFLHRPGRSVFVATGTGIAPFIAYCRSGIAGYVLLHGVAAASELYYRDQLSAAAALYVPCIPGGDNGTDDDGTVYRGRVTDYLRECLAREKWNFYLCGNGEMVRDAIRIIDKTYPDARIFTETFYK